MKILIVEDEIKTAKALSVLILSIQPAVEIVAIIQSVEEAVRHLLSNEDPDLIFMDIQLSDGLSFEIFNEIRVLSPVVFCTAFDEYAIDAFKANGIDYILKPFTKETVMSAFDKVKLLSKAFSHNQTPVDYASILNSNNQQSNKTSFLVFKNQKYITIPTASIAFFYVNNESPTLVTFEQKEYQLNLTMDTITSQLPAMQFYRLNRQYLINFDAIGSVEHYFSRKLIILLKVNTKDELLVTKHKSTEFLRWLENR